MNANKPGNCPCSCPCKYDPIVMPCRECVCNRYYCVEQPVICPHNTRVVNHFVPHPVYYNSYSQTEETVCHGTRQGDQMFTNTGPNVNL